MGHFPGSIIRAAQLVDEYEDENGFHDCLFCVRKLFAWVPLLDEGLGSLGIIRQSILRQVLRQGKSRARARVQRKDTKSTKKHKEETTKMGNQFYVCRLCVPLCPCVELFSLAGKLDITGVNLRQYSHDP
jgi:hypothetical protein